jgi:predicted transcriptional regulator
MFYIDQEVINESGLDIPEILLFYATSLNINFSQVLEQLIEKGLVHKTSPVVRYVLTDLGKEHLEYLFKEFFEPKESDDKLMELARELKNVFPQGKKEGLNYYWTESPVLIAKRLKLFFKK